MTVALLALAGAGSASAAALRVTWMPGYNAPGTPAKYNRVGVLKVGAAKAPNVLVFEPGTSAAAAYFVPLARWITSTSKTWQVWAVERRENLLDDQSVLNLGKRGKASASEVFNYYLGWLADRSVKHHIRFPPDSTVEFAKGWGMNVAVQDLRTVIAAAHRLGGKVVLGGHSLGGSVVTAYATWNFGGQPGAKGLAGLVYDDGGSFATETAQAAQDALNALNDPKATPWFAFGGIPAPYAGLFVVTGSLAVVGDPNSPSLEQKFPLLPSYLKPTVPVTAEGQFGYGLNYKTSPPSLLAAQAHLGTGLSLKAIDGYYGWNGAGALTPITRFAQMFAGWGVIDANGAEWYFPQRLRDDTRAVGNGIANPAQSVLDVHSTMGRRLPHKLLIYAFGTALGKQAVLLDAQTLAKQSGIPMRNLVLIDRQHTYSHNDPAGAYPKNAFFSALIPFLRRAAAS